MAIMELNETGDWEKEVTPSNNKVQHYIYVHVFVDSLVMVVLTGAQYLLLRECVVHSTPYLCLHACMINIPYHSPLK